MKFYRPRFFQIHELVHPDINVKYGQRAFGFLDAEMLWTIDNLRLRFGVCHINGRYKGHIYTESGLRKFDTTTGAKMSLHKFGRAFDLKFTAYSAEEIRQDMVTNPNLDCYKYITRCEKGTSWLHIDNFNIFSHGIMFFNPWNQTRINSERIKSITQ